MLNTWKDLKACLLQRLLPPGCLLDPTNRSGVKAITLPPVNFRKSDVIKDKVLLYFDV